MWTERYTTGALISVIANTLHTHMYHIYINPIALLSPQSVVIRSANHSESAVWHISAGEFPARALCELWTLCQFYFPSPHNNIQKRVQLFLYSFVVPWIPEYKPYLSSNREITQLRQFANIKNRSVFVRLYKNQYLQNCCGCFYCCFHSETSGQIWFVIVISVARVWARDIIIM